MLDSRDLTPQSQSTPERVGEGEWQLLVTTLQPPEIGGNARHFPQLQDCIVPERLQR